MNSFIRKFALLLLCVPSVTMVSLPAASMNYISASFPQYSEAVVTMLLTVPNLSVMLGIFAGPMLLGWLSIKKLTIAGMVIFSISSVLPAWCDSFWIIFMLRVLTGIGCGLVVPLQETYLATYPEKERASLMGLNITVGCLFAAILAVFSGILAEMDWHYVFYLYGVNIIVLLLAFIFLPEHAVSKEHSEEVTPQKQQKLSDYGNIIAVYYILLIACYLAICVINSQIAYYLEDTGMGGSAQAGVLISVDMIGCLIAGLVMGQYLRLLKGFAMPMVFVCSTIAFLILWAAQSVVIAGIGVFIIGIFASMIAAAVNYELSVRLPLHLFTPACAGSNFLIFVLQFVGPLIFSVVLDSAAGGSFRTAFLIYAVFQAVFIAGSLILLKLFVKDVDTKEAGAEV